MLKESVSLFDQINLSLLEPINFEMSYIMQLKRVDSMIQEARNNFDDKLNLDKVEELFKEFISADNSKSHLEEIREQISLFVDKTRMTLRRDSVVGLSVVKEPNSSEEQLRLLSNKYGTVCLDQIVAKTPKACLHDLQLKLLSD